MNAVYSIAVRKACVNAYRPDGNPLAFVDVDYKDIDLPSVTSRSKQSPKASDTG
jgi:hypothetical protein